MSFSVATAISRLESGMKSAFADGATAAQKLQRVNEVLDRFFEFGTFRGVRDVVTTLTTTSGVMTLAASYQRLDALSVTTSGQEGKVDIKGMEWPFRPNGPGVLDWSKYPDRDAIDMGDVGGVRKYQLTGPTAALDALTYSGLARKRFVWITDTATVVVPDSFQALRMGVLALGFEDVSDYARSGEMFAAALKLLESNLEEFNSVEQYGFVALDNASGMGGVENVL